MAQILTEGLPLAQVSNNAEISIWRIVWVTRNCPMHGRCIPI